VKRVYSYGTGGPAAPADKPVLAWLGERFAEGGYRLPDLLRTIATSQPFLVVNDVAVAAAAPAATPAVATSAVAGAAAGARR
jgi:hypothetical protein